MILMAAAALAGVGEESVSKLEGAYTTFGPLLGPLAQTAFAGAVLCSGPSSSTIGVLAGQVIIDGFLNVRFPIYLRRLITIIPALAVIVLGIDEFKLSSSRRPSSLSAPPSPHPARHPHTRHGRVPQQARRRLRWMGCHIAHLALTCVLIVQIATG